MKTDYEYYKMTTVAGMQQLLTFAGDTLADCHWCRFIGSKVEVYSRTAGVRCTLETFTAKQAEKQASKGEIAASFAKAMFRGSPGTGIGVVIKGNETILYAITRKGNFMINRARSVDESGSADTKPVFDEFLKIAARQSAP